MHRVPSSVHKAPVAEVSPLSRGRQALLLLGALAAWLLARAVPIHLCARPFGGNDVHIYWRYAYDWWTASRAPYLQFHPEYPPGGLLVFLAPYLLGGKATQYPLLFGAEMAMFDLGAYALVYAWARRLAPGSRARPLLACALYLLATATLTPVLYNRYDLAASTLTLAALYLAYRPGQDWSSALLLGLAAAVKLWPLALAPMWLILAYRRGSWRQALASAGWMFSGLLVPALPFLPVAGLHIFDFLRYHFERGLQIESTWSPFIFFAGQAHDSLQQIAFAHGAVELHGALASRLTEASTPVLVALCLAPPLLALRSHSGSALESQQLGLFTAAAVTLGFIVGGKVLSPQFLLWIVPLLALATDSRRFALALLACAGLTTAVFPALYDALQSEHSALRPLAVACLFARNLLLLGFYVALLRRIARTEAVPLAPAAPACTPFAQAAATHA